MSGGDGPLWGGEGPSAVSETARSGGDVDRWAAELNVVEAHVAAVEAALDRGEVVALADWEPPCGLTPPVPPPLLGRAARLLDRLQGARERAQGRVGWLRQELDDLDRRRDASATYASDGFRTA